MTKKSPRPIHKIYYHHKTKQTLEEKVLSYLFDEVKSFLDATLPRKYIAYTGLARYLFGLDLKPDDILRDDLKKSIDNTFYRLKEKGLIYNDKSEKKVGWKLTKKGEEFIKNTKQQKTEHSLPTDDITRIFVFDIPEKMKLVRNLIRRELISYGYQMLQRSVWIGNKPLPLGFLAKIREMGLFENIHLFEVKEKGTLQDWIIDDNNENS